MAFSRANLYNKGDQQTSFFARALSHPARICIIRKLRRKGPCTVEELMDNHPITQPSISQHLEILRKAHLVNYKEEYPYTFYSLHFENADRLKRQIKDFLDDI